MNPVVRASHPVDSLRLTHSPLAPATNVFKTKGTTVQTSIRAKAIVLALMLLTMSPAWADWVNTDSTDDATYYMDPATVRKDGNLRSAWTLQDYKERQIGGEMSARGRMEFDCKNKRFRVLSVISYSGPMGTGKILGMTGKSTSWSDDASDLVDLEIVCSQ